MLRHAFLALLLISTQVPPSLSSNPVLRSLQSLGIHGTATKAAPATSPTKFKREPKSSTLDGVLKELLDTEEERDLVREMTGKLATQLDDQLKGQGLDQDVSGAAAFAMTIFASSITEQQVTDEGFLSLAKQIQSAMDRPEVRNAGDVRKQQVYELSLVSASVALIATQAESTEGKKKAKQLSSMLLRLLTGASPDQLKVESGRIRMAPRPAPEPATENAPTKPAPATEGLAPGFSFSVPQGWVLRDGWYVRERVASQWEGHREVTGAHIRLLPAVPAQGSMAAVLEQTWKQYLPAEAQGKQSAMVYRRYVGDQVFGQFVFGAAMDKGRDVETIYTTLLLDCKSHWQPVVIAATYDDNTAIRSTVRFVARSMYPDAADLAEEILRTFRCPSAKGTPIATVEALAGNYAFGSGSTLWTENVYTGATSMAYTSIGGTLYLKPDRTFVWKWGSASGRDGFMKTNSINATGKWSIQDDMLHVVYETYDQGDAYKAKDRKYRIAGLTTFSDGVKVAILMFHPDRPINFATVNDRGDWYSTKK